MLLGIFDETPGLAVGHIHARGHGPQGLPLLDAPKEADGSRTKDFFLLIELKIQGITDRHTYRLPGKIDKPEHGYYDRRNRALFVELYYEYSTGPGLFQQAKRRKG